MAGTSQRYDDSARLWYFWCLRTGQGDPAKAREVLDAHLKRVGKPRVDGDRHAAGVALVADGKPKEAAEQFEACFSGKNTFFLMLPALLWDAVGDAGQRDRLFDKLPADDPSAPLISLLRVAIKKGEKAVPTQAELDAVWTKLPDWTREPAGYFVGRFLLTRGEEKRAKAFFESAAKRT